MDPKKELPIVLTAIGAGVLLYFGFRQDLKIEKNRNLASKLLNDPHTTSREREELKKILKRGKK